MLGDRIPLAPLLTGPSTFPSIDTGDPAMALGWGRGRRLRKHGRFMDFQKVGRCGKDPGFLER